MLEGRIFEGSFDCRNRTFQSDWFGFVCEIKCFVGCSVGQLITWDTHVAWNPLDLDRAPERVQSEAEIGSLRSVAFESSGKGLPVSADHDDGVGVAVGVFYPVQRCSKSFYFFFKGRGDSPAFDAGAMQNFGVRRAPSREDKPCTSVPGTFGCRTVRIDDQVSTRVADDADRLVFRVVVSVLSC